MAVLNDRISILDNGVTVATRRIYGAPRAALQIIVEAGPACEAPGQEGYAHALEHMFMCGPRGATQDAFHTAFKKLGYAPLSASTSLNAITLSTDHIGDPDYFDRDTMPRALLLYGAALCQPALRKKDWQGQRTRILEELAIKDSQNRNNIDHYFEKDIYQDMPRGRSYLGSAAQIEAITTKDIESYYHQNVTGRRLFVFASGDVDHYALVGRADRLFGKLPAGDSYTPAAPTLRTGRGVFVERSEDRIYLRLAWPGIVTGDARRFCADALAAVLTDQFQESLIDKKKLLYSLHAAHYSYRDAALFQIVMSFDPRKTDTVLRTVAQDIHKVQDQVPPHLYEHRIRYLNGWAKTYETLAVPELTHMRDDYLNFGTMLSPQERADRLISIQPQDISAMARQIIAPPLSRLAVGAIQALPSMTALDQMFTPARPAEGLDTPDKGPTPNR